MPILAGGCFCGQTRYEITGEAFDSSLCHCVDCRRASAAPFVAWVSVKRIDFRWLTTPPKTFQSSPAITRSFCPHCGTPLTFQSPATPDVVDLTTCSLDDPEAMPPLDQCRTRQRLSWSAGAGLPAYPGPREP